MIRFRRKQFAFWMPALMIGTTGLQMGQASEQAKEAEKQAEEQKAALDRQTKALNKIAKEAKNNPELASKVIAQKEMSKKRIKLFAAIPSGVVKDITGFGKDLWKTQSGNIKRAGKIGLGFGAMGYAGNRIATSLKDHDEGNDSKNKSFLGKAALGTAAIGGTYLAAKSGKLGTTISKPLTEGMKKVGRAVNPIQRKDGKLEKLPTALNFGFAAMPVVGYLGQRKQQQDQVAQTEGTDEREYSEKDGSGKKKALGILGTIGAGVGTVALARSGRLGARPQKFIGSVTSNLGGTMKSLGMGKSGSSLAKSGAETYARGVERAGGLGGKTVSQVAEEKLKATTGPNKISGGINKIGSFFGFYGKGGTEAVQNTAKSLANSENSAISKKVGEFLQNHKTTANLAAGAGSVALGTTIMGAAQKPFELFDSHAYDYEKQQNQKV